MVYGAMVYHMGAWYRETTHNKKGMHRPVGQTAADQVRRFQNGCPLPRVAAEAAGMVQRSLAEKLGWLTG